MEKKLLLEWLDKPYIDIPVLTNLEYIRSQWNTLNRTNKNVAQIKRIS